MKKLLDNIFFLLISLILLIHKDIRRLKSDEMDGEKKLLADRWAMCVGTKCWCLP